MKEEKQLSKFTTQAMVNKVLKYGAQILFITAIIILVYFSFVDDINLSTSVKNVTATTAVASVLNYLVWTSNYKKSYEKVLSDDITNKDYSIHKRYYLARKLWKYEELQNSIMLYNKAFTSAWIKDVEDITGRDCESIVKGKYVGNGHWGLIYAMKHRLYPKSGIKTPKDMLYILSVGVSNGMGIDVRAAEKHYHENSVKKAINLILGCFLTSSIVFTFIHDGWNEAVLKAIINVTILFMSLFFGSSSGMKGAKIKLNTAEIICEKLEKWSNVPPKEEPYKVDEVEKLISKPEASESEEQIDDKSTLIIG